MWVGGRRRGVKGWWRLLLLLRGSYAFAEVQEPRECLGFRDDHFDRWVWGTRSADTAAVVLSHRGGNNSMFEECRKVDFNCIRSDLMNIYPSRLSSVTSRPIIQLATPRAVSFPAFQSLLSNKPEKRNPFPQWEPIQ